MRLNRLLSKGEDINHSLKGFKNILIGYNILAGIVPFSEKVGAKIVPATPAR
jgi:hypothetical protein